MPETDNMLAAVSSVVAIACFFFYYLKIQTMSLRFNFVLIAHVTGARQRNADCT